MDSNPDIGISGPRNIDVDGNLQFSCDYFPSCLKSLWAYTNLRNRYPYVQTFRRSSLSAGDYADIRDVDKIMGCSLMIRSGLYRQIGGLDSNYFMYFEETDLCYRVKRLGVRVTYFPDVRIIHFHGESAKSQREEKVVSKTIVSYFYESQYYFFRKNYGFWSMVAMSLLDLIYGIALVVRNAMRKNQTKRELGLELGKALCSAFLVNANKGIREPFKIKSKSMAR